jgi:hypothetical protein
LLIAQQVDQAINNRARAIIVLFTSSTRFQTRINNTVVPYSIHSLDHTTPFTKHQLQLLKEYTTEFFDLEFAIYQNQLIIESVLTRLTNSRIPFLFDQGGFEHTSYGGAKSYFRQFDSTRSKFNLWDYASTRHFRPYYHIKDFAVHDMVANYYYDYFN